MWQLIDEMPETIFETPFSFEQTLLEKANHWGRDKNVRDILVHLYEWHELLLQFVEENETGQKRTFLPKEYNWKTYAKMNEKIWQDHQSTSFEEARRLIQESHDEIVQLFSRFTDEQLFVKKYYPWTGTTSLGSYCVSVSSAHYDWAMKKMKKHIQVCLS